MYVGPIRTGSLAVGFAVYRDVPPFITDVRHCGRISEATIRTNYAGERPQQTRHTIGDVAFADAPHEDTVQEFVAKLTGGDHQSTPQTTRDAGAGTERPRSRCGCGRARTPICGSEGRGGGQIQPKGEEDNNPLRRPIHKRGHLGEGIFWGRTCNIASATSASTSVVRGEHDTDSCTNQLCQETTPWSVQL